MLAADRHQMIIDLVKERGTATVQELCDLTTSSLSTIRRDLNQLDQAGRLKKVHGGAQYLTEFGEETDLSSRSVEHLAAKRAIAQYVVKQVIKPGQLIYLDAGSTCLQVIEALPIGANIMIVTNGLDQAYTAIHRQIDTILLGGAIRPLTRAIAGTTAYQQLSAYNFDQAFLGINGIDSHYGLTTTAREEADLKGLASRHSRRYFLLADQTKFGQAYDQRVVFDQAPTIITNSGPIDAQFHQRYRIKEVDV
ncbi:hypothetical protein AWM75_00385 [Aerococcus urinaehominis]|uniref:Uncharacterized protein n=1 Tax=Aerococcus urinaehominis TaxID=128944 RepID=A0A0X8FJL3_9LACT|nr:DeoR/GlpR family DNA-binding transcription regulator [Aerococcus urinaehominis]AMB98540.1 hypothetical protein AWM75_00385 [Aerococcus urinaehominis]SDL78847.1 transcriptional regulator, DeoR family [Aerococcus urinaehominis]